MGIITVVGIAPLGSMALTALLGLTGVPMAIGAMAAFSSAFMNGTLFHRLKLGDRKSTIAVSIEPLSQADIVSMINSNLYYKFLWWCDCWFNYCYVRFN